jgi:DNA-binding transcriptional LysR family regulator
MPDLRHLRNFLAVADELHFTRAARRLHLAQAALSQSMRQLESEIGVPLLVRTTRRVTLTEAGRAFYEHARLTLQTLERGITATVKIARESEKVVVLGFTSAGLYGRTPRMVREWWRQCKDVRFVFREYTADALVTALEVGQVELGVLHGHITNPAIAGITLEQERCVLAIPSGHALLRRRKPISLAGLKEENVILPPKTAFHGLYAEIEAACAHAGMPIAAEASIPSAQALIGLVAAEVGIAIVPLSIALPREGVAYRELGEDDAVSIERRLYWHKHTISPTGLKLIAMASSQTGRPRGQR